MKKYITITKPGLLLSNVMTIIVGYFVSTSGSIYWQDFIGVIVGVTFIMASATTLNNYFDRDIDAIMSRTKKRIAIMNDITPARVLLFVIFLFILGISILILFTNYYVALVSILGYIIYAFIYTLLLKRYSRHSTIIGSISGGVPPLAGYLAHSGVFTIEALIIFLILATWQMTHFYAIGIYRLQDYQDAKIKILPVTSGIQTTKYHMLFWSFLFLLLTNCLGFFAGLGNLYYFCSTLLGLTWCKFVLDGFKKNIDDIKWGKKVFFFSIFHLMFLSLFIILYSILFS